MSTMCLHLAYKHDAECARLLLSGGDEIMASLVDVGGHLTIKLIHVVAETDPARVQVKSSLDKSTEDLPSYLPDLNKAVMILALAAKTRETWEETYIDAEEECVIHAALSIEEAPSEDHNESGMSLLYKDCVAVKNSYLNCVELLVCFKANTRVQNLQKHGPTVMATFQDMCFNLNFVSVALGDSRSSLQKNQVMNKETGDMFPEKEFDDFNKSYGCYTGDKAPAFHWHFVFRKCSALVCVLKQDSKSASAAELGHTEKALDVTGFKRDNVMKSLGFHFLEFGIEDGAANAKDHIPGKIVDAKDAVPRVSLLWQPKCKPFPEPLSFRLIELPDLVPDHQYPMYSPTANNTGGFSDLIESQLVDTCSQSNSQSQQGNTLCSRSNTERVPIFVRKNSGKVVVLIVNLDEPSEHMMCLYEEKTKMKLTHQYFIYKRKMIDPDHTLLFYGVGRNSTIHACGFLLGGMPTTSLSMYVHDNRNKFLEEVTLPNGQISLNMTKKGCRFLNTWLSCFTTAFSMGKSWNGDFTLDDFKHVDGHILIIKKPRNIEQGSLQNDIREFVRHVEEILHSDKTYLIENYPPYLKTFTKFLSQMAMNDVLSAQDKLFVETHVCCSTPCDREELVIKLYRRYEGLDSNEMNIWNDAIEKATCPDPWSFRMPKAAVFKEMIEQAKEEGRGYSKSKVGAFTLIKDIAVHATDYRNKIANANGIELMVPAYLEHFLPAIIKNLIENNVDISAELLAAKIKCFCKICESADSSDSD